VAREKVQQVLLARGDECLLPLFEPFVRAKRPDLLLSALDSAGIQAARVRTTHPPPATHQPFTSPAAWPMDILCGWVQAGDALVVMRSLAAIADALAAFAGPRAGTYFPTTHTHTHTLDTKHTDNDDTRTQESSQ
jgi:hypothetical protein